MLILLLLNLTIKLIKVCFYNDLMLFVYARSSTRGETSASVFNSSNPSGVASNLRDNLVCSESLESPVDNVFAKQ